VSFHFHPEGGRFFDAKSVDDGFSSLSGLYPGFRGSNAGFRAFGHEEPRTIG
jgi:hypothetical protein